MNVVLTQQGAVIILDNVKSISLSYNHNEDGNDTFNVLADQFIIGTYDSEIKGLKTIQWIAGILGTDKANAIVMPSNTAVTEEVENENGVQE